MKKAVIILIFSLLAAFPVWAQNPNLGTAGAQFLKIPVGASAAAMGGAFTGMTGDATSVFWNPAGIMAIENSAAHFTYMRWFEMFDFSAVSLVQNFEDIGTIGVGLIVFSTDEMEITTETDPNGTGQFFDAQDMALSLSYARNLTDNFRFGISLKYINQRIWNETANGVAFDIGTQYMIPEFQNMTLAMSMTNFGPDMNMSGPDLSVKYDSDQYLQNRLLPTQMETEDYPLPLNFQFGVAFDVFRSRFISMRGAVDAVHPNDNEERVQFGAEVALFDRLYLRGGMKLNHDDENANLGVGFHESLGDFRLRLDYGYSMYDILPDVHFISAGFEF
jgi:hypothetical protein